MKKAWTAAISVILMLVSVFALPASALTSHTIVSADIDAYVNQDGTVSVTEVWTIEYIGASDGFTRWIDCYNSTNANGMTLLQKYDEVQDVSVLIDGVQAPESATQLNAYFCQKSEDGSSYDIVINSPSAQTTKEYTIAYTITGAVKKKSGKANFSFVFIGQSFEYTCNNVTVTVHAPDGTAAEDIAVPEDSSAVVSENTAVFSLKRVSDSMAVDVTMPDSAFDSGALVSYSAAKQNLKTVGHMLVKVIPWILLAAVAVLVVLFVLFGETLKRKRLERALSAEVSDAQPEPNCVLPEELSPCAAYKMLVPYCRVNPRATSKRVPFLFALAVLECIGKGYIVMDGSHLLVGTPNAEADVPDYITSVLNFLKTFCQTSDGHYVIDEQFGARVREECASNYDSITNYLVSFYALIPEFRAKDLKDESSRELYTKAFLCKTKAVELKSKTNYSDYIRNVLGGSEGNSAEIFSMMFPSLSADKFFFTGAKDAVAGISEAIGCMYSVFVKSK